MGTPLIMRMVSIQMAFKMVLFKLYWLINAINIRWKSVKLSGKLLGCLCSFLASTSLKALIINHTVISTRFRNLTRWIKLVMEHIGSQRSGFMNDNMLQLRTTTVTFPLTLLSIIIIQLTIKAGFRIKTELADSEDLDIFSPELSILISENHFDVVSPVFIKNIYEFFVEAFFNCIVFFLELEYKWGRCYKISLAYEWNFLQSCSKHHTMLGLLH